MKDAKRLRNRDLYLWAALPNVHHLLDSVRIKLRELIDVCSTDLLKVCQFLSMFFSSTPFLCHGHMLDFFNLEWFLSLSLSVGTMACWMSTDELNCRMSLHLVVGSPPQINSNRKLKWRTLVTGAGDKTVDLVNDRIRPREPWCRTLLDGKGQQNLEAALLSLSLGPPLRSLLFILFSSFYLSVQDWS